MVIPWETFFGQKQSVIFIQILYIIEKYKRSINIMGHIYCYTNKINNKKYIGQSINQPLERYNLHKSHYLNENSNEYNSVIHRAMRKYGFDNFNYEIIANYIDDQEILNLLEIYYIEQFNCQIPNGYNVEKGGKNCLKPQSQETKEKLMWANASLTEKEVIELRIAYQNKQSPTQIYNEKYKDRLHYNSFLNIWTGKRYSSVMPEVFTEKNRHTKLTPEIVHLIKEDRKNLNLSYQKLADKYNISKPTIAGIIQGRTWKEVQ